MTKKTAMGFGRLLRLILVMVLVAMLMAPTLVFAADEGEEILADISMEIIVEDLALLAYENEDVEPEFMLDLETLEEAGLEEEITFIENSPSCDDPKDDVMTMSMLDSGTEVEITSLIEVQPLNSGSITLTVAGDPVNGWGHVPPTAGGLSSNNGTMVMYSGPGWSVELRTGDNVPADVQDTVGDKAWVIVVFGNPPDITDTLWCQVKIDNNTMIYPLSMVVSGGGPAWAEIVPGHLGIGQGSVNEVQWIGFTPPPPIIPITKTVVKEVEEGIDVPTDTIFTIKVTYTYDGTTVEDTSDYVANGSKDYSFADKTKLTYWFVEELDLDEGWTCVSIVEVNNLTVVTNAYEAPYVPTPDPITVVHGGNKVVKDKDAPEIMFTFCLKDADGNTIRTATSLGAGSFNLDSIEYTEAGIYTYTVEEDLSSVPNYWKYDGRIFTIIDTVVEVEFEGEVWLEVSTVILVGDDVVDGVEFVNTYSPPPPPPVFPKTGDASSILYMLLALALVLLGSTMIVRARKSTI